jgi:hypothetical protein
MVSEDSYYNFLPDPLRARGLDRRLRARVADSLEHVADKIRGHLDFDEARFRRLTDGLRRGLRFPPTTFALYYDVVDAILENRLDAAQACLSELLNEVPNGQPLSIIALDSESLGAGMAKRYARMLDTDAATPYAFEPPSSSDLEAFTPLLDDALQLLQRGCGKTHAELVEIVDQIVLCNGTNLTNGDAFLAGSSFTLWGALCINPSAPQTVRSLVETLAHEAAHSLLFGIQISGALVLNSDDERFPSPLRDDLRPMDGIYHATFVLARMHFAMMELLDSGLLEEDDIEYAHAAVGRDHDNFVEGLRTIKEFGRLTPAGQKIMSDAEDYMMTVAS